MCKRTDFKHCAMFQIEQIKRANKLWTSDTLFLRDHLRIPVPCGSLQQQSVLGPLISNEQLPHLPSGISKVSFCLQRESVQRSQMTDSSAPVSLVAEDDLNQVDIDKYFSKYDSLLVKLKNSASELESNSRMECYFWLYAGYILLMNLLVCFVTVIPSVFNADILCLFNCYSYLSFFCDFDFWNFMCTFAEEQLYLLYLLRENVRLQ